MTQQWKATDAEPEGFDGFIVRLKFAGQSWLYWSRDREMERAGYPEEITWRSNPEDPDMIIFTLEKARAFVKNWLQDAPDYRLKTYIQIRPWYCDSNDPRIEDYELGKNYDWDVSFPHKTVQEFVPMAVVEIEGGVVVDVWTNLPELEIAVLDHDAAGEGDVRVDTYVLKPSQGSVSTEALSNLIDEFLGVKRG